MSSLRAALIALFAASVAMAAVMVALVVSSDHESAKELAATLGPFIGLSFCGTGVFAWLRRPHNRFGALMTGVGFAWFLSALTEANDPWVYTLGVYLGPLYLVLVGHMLLAFPSGRLETTAARTLIAVAYLDALLVQLPYFFLNGDISGDRPRAGQRVGHHRQPRQRAGLRDRRAAGRRRADLLARRAAVPEAQGRHAAAAAGDGAGAVDRRRADVHAGGREPPAPHRRLEPDRRGPERRVADRLRGPAVGLRRSACCARATAAPARSATSSSASTPRASRASRCATRSPTRSATAR